MRELSEKEKKLNDDAADFARGIIGLMNNILGPLLGEVERNKQLILSTKAPDQVKEILIMKMTLGETVEYINQMKPRIENLMEGSSTWRNELDMIKRQENV